MRSFDNLTLLCYLHPSYRQFLTRITRSNFWHGKTRKTRIYFVHPTLRDCGGGLERRKKYRTRIVAISQTIMAIIYLSEFDELMIFK